MKEQEDKEKEKEDEVNEMALQAADALSASNGDLEMDPADLKMATMDELKRRWRITKGEEQGGSPGVPQTQDMVSKQGGGE